MKRSLLPLVSMLIFVRCITLSALDTVNVSVFGLKPGTRENAVLLARKALETCRTKSNPVLLFPRGRYDFWPQYAAEKIYYESNTDVIPFRRCAILIENINGLTVECDGSEFIFHDLIQPFTVDRSSNITIRNVSIDWDVPLTAQAEIIENNVFESSGSSILIAGDANGWYESGAVTDVLIRHNTFNDPCMTSMYQFCEGIISIFPEIPKQEYSKPFHRNIRIEENEFHPFDFPVLYAKSADGISFTGNKLIRSHRFLPFHHRRSIFTFENCLNISIKANSFESDVLGKNVTLASTPLKQVKLDKQQKLIIEK